MKTRRPDRGGVCVDHAVDRLLAEADARSPSGWDSWLGDRVTVSQLPALGLPRPRRRAWALRLALEQVEAADLSVLDSGEAAEATTFADVGALAWYLSAIPWAVDDFSIAAHRPQVERLHARIEADGPIALDSLPFGWRRPRIAEAAGEVHHHADSAESRWFPIPGERASGGHMTAAYELGSSPRSVQLRIPARPEYIRLGRLALTGLVRMRPLSAEVLGDLKLALTEACSVRRHSAGSDGTLEIRYELHDEYVVVEVSDRDAGFVIDEEPGSRGQALSEPTMALGIIRALADELELGRCDDGSGSRLRFVKRLDG